MTIKEYITDVGVILTPTQIEEFDFYSDADNEIIKTMLDYRYGIIKLAFEETRINPIIYTVFHENKDRWSTYFQTLKDDFDPKNTTDVTTTITESVITDTDNTSSSTLGTKVSNESNRSDTGNKSTSTFDSAQMRVTDGTTDSSQTTSSSTNSGTDTGTSATDETKDTDRTEHRVGHEGYDISSLLEGKRRLADFFLLNEICEAVRMAIGYLNYDFLEGEYI